MTAESAAARLNRLTLLNNIPLGAQLELTRRCPLVCAHCYLPRRSPERPDAELSKQEWKGVIRSLKGLGCLSLVLTGGEPLLRPDLAELCAYASRLGFEIRVFTSGAGLTEALAKALRPANISCFELSFYGRPAAHDAVTGVPGSCLNTLAAARLLKKSGFRVKLKAPLMRATEGQLSYISRLCRREGFAYAFDPALTLASDGNRANLRLRLPARRLAALLADPVLYPAEPNLCGASAADSPPCGAGRNTVFIAADGAVQPCLQLGVDIGNALKTPLEQIWRSSAWLKRWRRAKVSDSKACRGCADLDYCSRCPGVSLLEGGGLNEPYAAACMAAGAAHAACGKKFKSVRTATRAARPGRGAGN